MRTRKYRKVAAAALGSVAMVSSAMAFDADWDGSYGRADGDACETGAIAFRSKRRSSCCARK